jgi:hypothetical protein
MLSLGGPTFKKKYFFQGLFWNFYFFCFQDLFWNFEFVFVTSKLPAPFGNPLLYRALWEVDHSSHRESRWTMGSPESWFKQVNGQKKKIENWQSTMKEKETILERLMSTSSLWISTALEVFEKFLLWPWFEAQAFVGGNKGR